LLFQIGLFAIVLVLVISRRQSARGARCCTSRLSGARHRFGKALNTALDVLDDMGIFGYASS
jgi:hypothetical protein